MRSVSFSLNFSSLSGQWRVKNFVDFLAVNFALSSRSSSVLSGRASASSNSPKMRSLLPKEIFLMFFALFSRRRTKVLYWISTLLLLVLNTTSATRARPITSQIHAPETGGAGRRRGLPGEGGGVVRG